MVRKGEITVVAAAPARESSFARKLGVTGCRAGMSTKSTTKSTTSHDVEVGQRIRARRMAQGMSQTELGNLLGVTFQQVQKYEKGVNRVGAGRLVRVGEALDVPVSFFFDDTDPVRAPAMGGFAEPPAEAFESDPLRKRETVELVRAYFSIEDAVVRQRLYDLVKALAAGLSQTLR